MDYTIKSMTRHPEGFFVGVVLSYHTQREITCHNRYGAWFAGDPDAKGEPMRDLRHDLCAVLQARMRDTEKGINKIADNPFVIAAQQSNPFMALAGATARERSSDGA